MTTKRKPTQTETQRFIQRMRRMKANEKANGVNIYSDALLRVTVVVELGGVWWLVPRSRDGWHRRQRLTLTPEVRLERLTPAAGISPEWLGVTVGPARDEESERCTAQ